ncbi:MAG: hypothetical protein J0L70_18335 [Leptolyngbya sp. UWPOB_LEPTO1]|uniref:hypothetical protein n=1 Tax=Leptolyngbya sp. UWPOB_LEPTO1 TaxID=2815653 RepID=UPI001AC681E7|nr:hypothetical protein [Leptolyngbya sp. UWPOB_LEPTO1]MBN8562494.1 hypothetical protein [Leptolyngbya sp. UWPOB_LEPTO1]
MKTVAERIFEALDRFHESELAQREAVTSDPSQQASDLANPKTLESGKRKKKSKKESDRTNSTEAERDESE